MNWRVGWAGSKICGAIQSGVRQFHSASAEHMNSVKFGHHFARGMDAERLWFRELGLLGKSGKAGDVSQCSSIEELE